MTDTLPALSVSDITSMIKELLEGSFPTVIVEGEISNYRPSSTGHLYFTLKDENSAISAVMFKGKSRYLPFEPRDGMLVRATGSVSVYAARGSYQIIVDSMSQAGTGDLLRILEDRKRRLAGEGLFDSERKRPLPAFPERIAVITSPTGAAVRDILQIMRRRNSCIGITVLPAPVQGADAAPALVRQLETANRFAMADVIIIGRGGGSLEDLMPFSDEALVRAIAASRIPVVSAVGHEIDWALSDFAADVRAPTPSAAAELVTPLKTDLYRQIADLADSLHIALESRAERIRLTLSRFSPDSLEMLFRRIEQPTLLRFDDAKEALLAGMRERVERTRHRIDLMRQSLDDGNPETILARGYAMVRTRNGGAIVRDAMDVFNGDILEIRPARGMIVARVEDVEKTVPI